MRCVLFHNACGIWYKKGLGHVLPGFLGNESVENLFSKSTPMTGGNYHLDVPSFNHVQRTLLLRE